MKQFFEKYAYQYNQFLKWQFDQFNEFGHTKLLSGIDKSGNQWMINLGLIEAIDPEAVLDFGSVVLEIEKSEAFISCGYFVTDKHPNTEAKIFCGTSSYAYFSSWEIIPKTDGGFTLSFVDTEKLNEEDLNGLRWSNFFSRVKNIDQALKNEYFILWHKERDMFYRIDNQKVIF